MSAGMRFWPETATNLTGGGHWLTTGGHET
jgi:hypothetical protein